MHDKNNLPWDDVPGPLQKATEAIADTLEASRSLDKLLTAAIDSGLVKEEKIDKPKGNAMSNKLTSLVDIMESGIKELEDEADILMPRFQKAHAKGRDNMTTLRGNIQKLEEATQKVEEFNKKVAGNT